jgi:hypothetical protein
MYVWFLISPYRGMKLVEGPILNDKQDDVMEIVSDVESRNVGGPPEFDGGVVQTDADTFIFQLHQPFGTNEAD